MSDAKQLIRGLLEHDRYRCMRCKKVATRFTKGTVMDGALCDTCPAPKGWSVTTRENAPLIREALAFVAAEIDPLEAEVMAAWREAREYTAGFKDSDTADELKRVMMRAMAAWSLIKWRDEVREQAAPKPTP